MGLTSFINIGIIIFIIGILLFRFKGDKNLYKNNPFTFSIIALVLIILNWTLYLSNFYVFLSEKISDIVFLPIWFTLSIIGLIAALKEFKNNLFIALLTGGVSIITFIVGMLLLLIGSM